MSLVGDILAIAKELRSLGSNFSDAKKEQRERIAEYFSQISDCLDGTYKSLKNNEVPHKRCAEMKIYAELLPSTLGGTIKKSHAEQLSKRLSDSHEVELLWGTYNNNPQEKAELPKLAEASGVFAALATSLRAGLNI